MLLVDTSVWIDHLNHGEASLFASLEEQRVLIHPFIIGELALGNLSDRKSILETLLDLPEALVARDEEVLRLIEGERLFGSGIGYVDAHLLAATRLTAGSSLWTRDKRLRTVAARLGIDAEMP
jgi:predicted nucleic acid-binding protein